VDDSSLVRAVFERIRARVLSGDGDDVVGPEVVAALPPLERAVYTTRALEDELADGGWYLIFANEDEDLVTPALAGYGLLGLPAYADHLREVLAAGYGDESSEAEGERLDDAFAALSGSEEARAAAIREAGLGA
jgi:hypothetical protein